MFKKKKIDKKKSGYTKSIPGKTVTWVLWVLEGRLLLSLAATLYLVAS